MSEAVEPPPFDERLGAAPAAWSDVPAPPPWRVVCWRDSDYRDGSADNLRRYPRMLDLGGAAFQWLGLAVFAGERELTRLGIPDAAVGNCGAVVHRCGSSLLVGAHRTLTWLRLPDLVEAHRLALADSWLSVMSLHAIPDSDEVLVVGELAVGRAAADGTLAWITPMADIVSGAAIAGRCVHLQLDDSCRVTLDLATGAPCPS